MPSLWFGFVQSREKKTVLRHLVVTERLFLTTKVKRFRTELQCSSNRLSQHKLGIDKPNVLTKPSTIILTIVNKRFLSLPRFLLPQSNL